jgi:hypothetical protein
MCRFFLADDYYLKFFNNFSFFLRALRSEAIISSDGHNIFILSPVDPAHRK